ncbi:hypothetical protein CDAR_555381 [Caerostris darwini]|uniref:Uncharacterized protein n=1 Tax=Caerostris darwini TaxID=1538125 RepID=A0AAV4Q7P5_9ARAC|nr:hypothetical protein CDAR_555381 [Caerostris darwini]
MRRSLISLIPAQAVTVGRESRRADDQEPDSRDRGGRETPTAVHRHEAGEARREDGIPQEAQQATQGKHLEKSLYTRYLRLNAEYLNKNNYNRSLLSELTYLPKQSLSQFISLNTEKMSPINIVMIVKC